MVTWEPGSQETRVYSRSSGYNSSEWQQAWWSTSKTQAMTLIPIWPVWYGCGLQHLIPDVFVTQDAVLVEMHTQSLLVYVLAKDSEEPSGLDTGVRKAPMEGMVRAVQAEMLQDPSKHSTPDFFPWPLPPWLYPHLLFLRWVWPILSLPVRLTPKATLSFFSALCRPSWKPKRAAAYQEHPQDGQHASEGGQASVWGGQEGSYHSQGTSVPSPCHPHLVHPQESLCPQFPDGIEADRGPMPAHI